jgi:hypothetical protein
MKELGLGVYAGLGGTILDRYTLSAGFRFLDFTGPSSVESSHSQYELYASAGYVRRAWGLSLHYAFLADQTNFSGNSHHVAGVGRWSPLGDLTVEVAGSVYDDAKIARGEFGWRVPLGAGFSLRPAFAAQYAATTAYGNGSLATGLLALSFDRTWGSLFVGGKYGEEFRPASLSRDVVWNLPERIEWGAWAGARLRVKNIVVGAAYEFDRLRVSDGTSELRNVHFLSLTFSGSFSPTR